MHFLPDVYVECETCKGKRYNRETLEVHFKGKSIADVLDMTVEDAQNSSAPVPRSAKRWMRWSRWAGYIKVGQQATTLSGGEAQRVKLIARNCRAAPPARRSISSTSRPPACISRMCEAAGSPAFPLVDQGNTVVVIEHNLDVIKTADWIIDIGPEGGDGGGRIVATGTPEDVAQIAESHTGRYLAPMLETARKRAAGRVSAVIWQRIEGAGLALGGLLVAALAAPGWGAGLAWAAGRARPCHAGPRIGAFLYNCAHIYALPFLLMVAGVALGSTALIAGAGYGWRISAPTGRWGLGPAARRLSGHASGPHRHGKLTKTLRNFCCTASA